MISAPTEVDPTTMRRTIGRFATGVAVVTTIDGEHTPHGMTVNSLTSVSLDPPLLLVCLNHGARTATAISERQRFAVSLLSARQETIARRFATRADDHFAGLPLTYGEHQVPIVPDTLAHLECTVDRTIEAADHIVIFGLVQHTCQRDGQPLAFLGGRFGDYTDRGHEPVPWFF